MVFLDNIESAEDCFRRAQTYQAQGSIEDATRLAQKANRMHPSDKYQDFIDKLNQRNGSNSASGNGKENKRSESPPSGNTRQRNNETSAPAQASYSQDQLEAVKNIKKCKDCYEILGVTKEATDSDLKKAYRKLALQFHPDKNKAPGATEAFKAVGNAMAILSDAEKRKHYNLYGPEDQAQQMRSNRTHYDQSRDMTAEELFNMFFGGASYPASSRVYTRRGRTRHHNHQTHETHTENSGLSVMVQLMPLLLILLMSLASSLFSSDPVYSLTANSKYTDARSTPKLHVPYFVKPDFAREYQGSIRRLEHQVEEDYITALRNGCYKERNHKENMLWRARSFGDGQMYRRAQELNTPSCDTLQAVYN